MDVFVIEGGRKLRGEVSVSGAKNAALPLMCATLLSAKPTTLFNTPKLTDIAVLIRVLEGLGVTSDWDKSTSTLKLNASRVTSFVAPYELVSKMRASVLVLGPLLARFGQAVVSLPGGCAIGARPVDILLQGLKALGAEIELFDGYIHAKAPHGLIGTEFRLEKPAVTGTENLIMAATLAKGRTVLRNVAKEPEIIDLVQMLRQMGANIHGEGTNTITIHGQKKLMGAKHHIMPDRIEAGTFALAAAMVGDGVKIHNARLEDNIALVQHLRNSGVGIEIDEKNSTFFIPPVKKRMPLNVVTEPFPGFPTDLQAQMMAYTLLCDGQSTIKEQIYENRFMHVLELKRMAANLQIEGQTVSVGGHTDLKGAPVMATDLRASACLVLAALAAKGQTVIRRIYHLDRGYDRLEEKLVKLGADVTRMDEKAYEALSYEHLKKHG